MLKSLWIRHETNSDEHRTPLVPRDAARLVQHGVIVNVEDSPQRTFAAADYAEVGCIIVPPGSWVEAPAHSYILGLKELPFDPPILRHRHVFFAHAYKGQAGASELLRRFAAGGGTLLDLEYLTDERGRRLAAFGYWAGYVGAALAVLHRCGELVLPLQPFTKTELDHRLARTQAGNLATLVIGALGRCGKGARDALSAVGIQPTCWDVEETRELDRAALLRHELFVNAVLTMRPVPPFVTTNDLVRVGRRLTVIADVTCDVTSPHHALPIYWHTTSWKEPVSRLAGLVPPLDVIALDNLPSLLPRESSTRFSADLLPHIVSLGNEDSPWPRCRHRFLEACRSLEIETEQAHV